MYKGASQNLQHAAVHVRLSDMAKPGDGEPTREDQIDALRRRIKQIDGEIQRCTNTARRKALGQEKFRLQEERRVLGKPSRPVDFAQHFIDAVKERVSPALFKVYFAAARAKSEKVEAE